MNRELQISLKVMELYADSLEILEYLLTFTPSLKKEHELHLFESQLPRRVSDLKQMK
jgi:hypothetical protein